jgi:hypothetical protein
MTEKKTVYITRTQPAKAFRLKQAEALLKGAGFVEGKDGKWRPPKD